MKEKLKWAIDLDGVITANPSVFSWMTYHLLKNENNNEVFVLSWRDGSDDQRRKETERDLERFGIVYTELIMAPKKLPSLRAAAFWKISEIQRLGIHIWFDDEIKSYKRDLGINLERLLPDVQRIWI